MRIAVDAMGGDFAPHEVVLGTVTAAQRFPDTHLLLVGQEDKVRAELAICQGESLKNIEVVHAPQVVGMDESPVASIREKPESSITRCAELVKKGEANAMVGMGNTGAMAATATLKLGRLEGVRRAGIAVPFPSMGGGPCVVIDAGANIAPRPEHLVDYAIMASEYCRCVFNKPNPKVGLLSIGEEDEKGNDLVQATLPLLRRAPINFFRNVEGRDVFNGSVDVVVCDGFVGNVILKAAEGLGSMVMQTLQAELTKNLFRKLGTLMIKNALRGMKRRLDYAEYGGALLLGVNGVVIIGHGGSKARAVENSIRVAREAVNQDLNKHIIAAAKRGLATTGDAPKGN